MPDFFSAVMEAVKKLMTTGICTLLWFARIEIDQFIEVTFSKNSIFGPSIAGIGQKYSPDVDFENFMHE